jgi:protein TonB
MKPVIIAIIFAFIFSTAKAQQNLPPKNPKDPDSTIVINMPVGTNTQASLDTSKVYGFVEQEPTFPGGPKKWLEYIKANLKYPEAAKADHAEGRVFVTFVVERDGSVTNPKILRGIGNGCDEEAQRLLKNSPKWNPGMQNGKTVRVQYIVPIDFKL